MLLLCEQRKERPTDRIHNSSPTTPIRGERTGINEMKCENGGEMNKSNGMNST